MKQISKLGMKKPFFDHLDEREKRHYAAIEAENLGYGGQVAVEKAFGISAKTIRKGIFELHSPIEFLTTRIRKEGGGRKKNFDNT